jgi:hypothetical protein
MSAAVTTSQNPSPRPAQRTAARFAPILVAAALDAVLVILFAALGRGSHAREATLAGLWETAWPFLAGLAIAWIAALVWRRPAAVLRSGLPVWIGTVTLGLVLRVLGTDGGAALPFVLVATGTLGVLLLGWRAVWALIGRLRRRPAAPPEVLSR